MKEKLGEVNVETVSEATAEELQSIGISFRKAEYIKDFARKVKSGEFDIDRIEGLSDEHFDKMKETIADGFLGYTFSFADGKATVAQFGNTIYEGSYTQEGSVLTIAGEKYNVRGRQIVVNGNFTMLGEKLENVVVKVYFKA